MRAGALSLRMEMEVPRSHQSYHLAFLLVASALARY